MSQKNLKRGGFYWKEEQPYLSVTEILKVIDKSALRYWFGEQVFLAMVKDPTLSKEVALRAPYEVSTSARSRGTTVHSIIESYKHTKEQLDVVEEFRGYAQAFYKFIEEYKPDILEHERTIFSPTHRYGGTLDVLMRLGQGKPIVVDIKTGKDIYGEAFLQTAAYHEALKEEGYDLNGTAVLLLQEDGAYKFENRSDCKRQFGGFLHAKGLYEALHEDELKKVGYLK